MRIIMSAAALALLYPALAVAQVAGANQPVALEIVASGDLEVPATKLTMTISVTETGSSQAAADKARDAKIARIEQALQQQGLAPSALSPVPDGATPLSFTTIEVGTYSGSGEDPDAAPKHPSFSALWAKILTVGSSAKAASIKAALKKIGVQIVSETADLDDASLAATQREAKAKALRAARADAEVYAKEMGLRVNRIVRISEAGNGLFLPGFQAKIATAITKGPQLLASMFKPGPGTVFVEKGLVVEFELIR